MSSDRRLNERPLLTKVCDSVEDFSPEPDSSYILARSGEFRSAHSESWEEAARAINVRFCRVTSFGPSGFTIELNGRVEEVALRSSRQLSRLWQACGSGTVYLDITGLPHHVWAPLLRVGIASCNRLLVTYVEPRDYRFSQTPTEGEIFDLSEKISGVAAIPGFATLTDEGDDHFCFIPLLGFEGTRLAYILEHVQPPGERIVPVVGVPGFQPEYPFYAYLGNRSALTETHAWRNVRLAIANCPFSLFYLLEDIAAEYPGDSLKIAPIGTKPHALGAILFAVSSTRSVEIVYDHPIRKSSRTEGIARLLAYDVSGFVVR
ncbi:MAG: hypothetical protein ABUT39_18635 [Acidobacteriota bacterium]